MEEFMREASEATHELQNRLAERLEERGLYIQNLAILPAGNPPMEGQSFQSWLDDGNMLMIQMTLRANKLAFSDRFINPDKAKADEEFMDIMPSRLETAEELAKAELAEMLKELKEE